MAKKTGNQGRPWKFIVRWYKVTWCDNLFSLFFGYSILFLKRRTVSLCHTITNCALLAGHTWSVVVHQQSSSIADNIKLYVWRTGVWSAHGFFICTLERHHGFWSAQRFFCPGIWFRKFIYTWQNGTWTRASIKHTCNKPVRRSNTRNVFQCADPKPVWDPRPVHPVLDPRADQTPVNPCASLI